MTAVLGTKAAVSGTRQKYAVDEQTGKRFKIVPETPAATAAAITAVVYLLIVLAFLLWLLLDTWTRRNLLLLSLGYDPKMLAQASFRLMAFVAIGGAMGGAVDGIRSVISWHSERQAYGPRFLWKDVSLPLTGATVGLFVYATVRGGAGVVSGDFSLDSHSSTPALAAFAVAALAGFSSQQVFRWLDAQANKIFRVTKDGQIAAPDLTGKTQDDAKTTLGALKLVLGEVDEEPDDANIGKVIRQSPGAGAPMAAGDAVDVTVGRKAE